MLYTRLLSLVTLQIYTERNGEILDMAIDASEQKLFVAFNWGEIKVLDFSGWFSYSTFVPHIE